MTGSKRNILPIEGFDGGVAVMFCFACKEWAGLKGAAVAALYYGVQLVMSFRLARRWLPVSRFKA